MFVTLTTVYIIVHILATVNSKVLFLTTFVQSNKKEVHILNTLNIILELLKSQKKTQKELMDYLGLGKTAFTGWKNGSNRSYFKHIGKIADFFNVSTDYLLGKEEKTPTVRDYTYALYHGEGEITPGMQKEVDAYAAIAKKQLASETKKKKNIPFYEHPEFSGDEEFIKKHSADRDAALKYGLFGGDAEDVTPKMLNDVRKFADFIRLQDKTEDDKES